MKIKNIIPAIINTETKQLPAKIYEGMHSFTETTKRKAQVVSKECAQALNALFVSERIVRRTIVRSSESGQMLKAYITKTSKGPVTSFVMKDSSGNLKLGSAILMKTDNAAFSCEALKDYIANSIELVGIKSVNSSKNKGHFKGIGTELIKACVRESLEKGCKGRVHLDAFNTRPPTPFYYKCGFRFPSEEQNKMMELYLEGKTKFGIMPEAIKQGLMYLPEENVQKVLAL